MNALLRYCFLTLLPIATLSAHTEFGIQLWSLRKTFDRDPAEGLRLTRALGFRIVETHSTYGKKAADFAQELKDAGLEAVSAHFPYERFGTDLPGIIADAKALGVRWVCIAWIPNQGFDQSLARKLANDFNQWGRALREAGLRFAYHPHGYEFRPEADGRTALDVLIAETRPEDVSFELDVFWAKHGGADPVALLRQHPSRFKLMHVKDIRKGAPTGLSSGSAPASDRVAVGQGQLDWDALFAAGQAAGIEHYIIEDETEEPAQTIPLSMEFLRQY